jgi:hypothetical protein
MTTAVSSERATATWLTALAGLVILAVAFVMMACAAPSLTHPRPHEAMSEPASVWLTTQSWSASWIGPVNPGPLTAR